MFRSCDLLIQPDACKRLNDIKSKQHEFTNLIHEGNQYLEKLDKQRRDKIELEEKIERTQSEYDRYSFMYTSAHLALIVVIIAGIRAYRN